MRRQPRILAGTALGLLMASAPLGAFPLQGSAAVDQSHRTTVPLLFAQADCPEGETCAQDQAEPEAAPRKRKQREAEPAAEAAPAQEQAAPAAEPEATPRRKKQRQPEPAQADDAAPAEQAAPAAEPEAAPRRKKERQQQTSPAEQSAPAEQAAPTEEKAAPAAEPERKPRKRKEPAKAAEPVPAPEAAPLPEPAPAEQTPPAEGTAPSPEPKPTRADEEKPVQGEKPADRATRQGKRPNRNEPAARQPTTGDQPVQGKQGDTGEQPATGEQGQAPADENAAPILDSQKDAERPRRDGKGGGRQDRRNGGRNGERAETPRPVPVDQGPPPADDKAAQQNIRPEKIQPVREERGERRNRAPDFNRRERPKGADVVKEIGDRLIVQFNNQTIVESNDRPRMTRGAQDVYYEDLPRDRTRETIVRDDGTKVVTIRNRNGDVIQRSRITRDGHEYVLSYVDEQNYQDVRDWRDPGDDLPEMRLTIPRNEYILDSASVEDEDAYYDFLDQPPVEKVQRLYSIDEVKRSARVRDIARRIDLDTLNFEFGSASIADSEVEKLQGVADAMDKLLQKNPAETFLIEGHTDAVGTENANLALSDQRAEAVAEALTSVFGVPPENLSTQGYGEEYLKVDSAGPERENRRVAIRRITPLVAPVASAQ